MYIKDLTELKEGVAQAICWNRRTGIDVGEILAKIQQFLLYCLDDPKHLTLKSENYSLWD